jgi:hypothetical protein
MRVRTLAAAAAALLASCLAARADGPTGQFNATAEIETSMGTQSIGMSIVVTSPMTRADAKVYKKILKDRGQRGLAAAIRGGNQGSFRFGALEYPIDMVIAEPVDDGYKFIVITTRPLEYEEVRQGKASLNNPFTVAVFTVPDFGWGEGELFTKAALSISDAGKVQATQYKNRLGVLKDVTRQ